MEKKDKRCVYNGLEYTVTGKTALNKSHGRRLFEIQPKKTCGFEDSLNIWVPIEELYFIEDIKNDN